VGSDPLTYLQSAPHIPAPTGTAKWSDSNPNEAKLQRPANREYYTPENAGAMGNAYKTNSINNGLWTATPTFTAAKENGGGTGTFNTGYELGSKSTWESLRSNYAMRMPSKTRLEYGGGVDGGPHYVAAGSISGPA